MGFPLYYGTMENPFTSDNKKAFKIFGIESFIILILIVVILALLYFLGLFPGFSKNQGMTEVTPVNVVKKGAGITITPNPDLPKDVTILSDIPLLKAQIRNKEALINVFKGWNVYGRVFEPTVYANGSMSNKPLEKIIIRLTDKPQPANKFSNDQGKTVYSSSYAQFSPGQIEVKVQVDPTKSEDLGKQIMFQMTNMLIKMTNPMEGSNDKFYEREKLIDAEFDKIRDSSEGYFTFN